MHSLFKILSQSMVKKFKNVSKRNVYWLSIAIVGAIFGLSIQFAHAWTPPSTQAPGGNVTAPILTNGAEQIKTGKLTLGGGVDVTGGVVNVSGGNLSLLNGKNLCLGGECRNSWNKFFYMDSSGDGNWTRIVSSHYDAGAGNHSIWWNPVVLDSTRPVLGIRISGTSDDGGLCIATVPGYFSGGVTRNAFITGLDVWGSWTGWAWNNNAGPMATGAFIFDGMQGGRDLGSQGYGQNVAWNKAIGQNASWTSIPAGRWLYYHQWYNDGQGAHYNDCYIDVMYGN